MKKIAALLLILVMLVGCGAQSTDESISDVPSKKVSSEASASSAIIPETNDYKEHTYKTKQIADHLLLSQRCVTVADGIVFDQAGASIAFTADCEGDITLSITASPFSEDTDHRFYTVYVDGKRTNRITAVVDSSARTLPITVTVAEGLEKGKHEIRVHRATPAEYGKETIHSITMNGVPAGPPEASGLLIEFVGDSITAGLELLDGDGDGFAPARCDSTQTYAFFTAEDLGAEFSSVCCGGLPFTVDYGNMSIRERYARTSFQRELGAFDFKRPADVVVINLGTNDYGNAEIKSKGFTDDEVAQKAKEFIEFVKLKNPGAKIVWAYGMLGKAGETAFKKGVELAGGEKAGVYYCQLPDKLQGDDGHPSVESHRKAADALTGFLKTNVGITA